MEPPDWYGLRYPTLADLEAYAESRGAAVVWTRGSWAAFYPGNEEEAPALHIPKSAGYLEKAWLLAHELAHLVLHTGPKGSLSYTQGEARASRWAACALIPQERIKMYGNASLDAFIGALSAHYEDLPYEDCPARRMAADIAEHRLKAMEAAA